MGKKIDKQKVLGGRCRFCNSNHDSGSGPGRYRCAGGGHHHGWRNVDRLHHRRGIDGCGKFQKIRTRLLGIAWEPCLNRFFSVLHNLVHTFIVFCVTFYSMSYSPIRRKAFSIRFADNFFNKTKISLDIFPTFLYYIFC